MSIFLSRKAKFEELPKPVGETNILPVRLWGIPSFLIAEPDKTENLV